MPTRRWLLRSSLLAGAGVATLGLGVAEPWLQPLARRVGVGRTEPTTWSQSPPPERVDLMVDTTRTIRAISPLIYGVSVATPEQLRATGATLNRWGGNPNTRYNWVEGDAWNAARDWEFRNYGGSEPGQSSPSHSADQFVSDTRAAGATAWLSVPAIGWVARDGVSEHASTGVPADGGPPARPGSEAIAGYDPSANRVATSVPSLARAPSATLSANPVYQDQWVSHLVERFGKGGVGTYAIDNEPDLWAITHTDVHPVQPDYAEMLSVFIEYASAIKDIDPGARVTGPSLSGWLSMFYSARDRGSDNYRTHADRKAHGDMPFLPWWLDQLHTREQSGGRRLLDAIDVHYYPQAQGVYGALGDEATQRRRLRATRSLWDPTYVDESWIGDTVRLIPRLREWRDQFYPGTALAIGEWNFGADDTLNGALAIANVLGIFGREGLDIASYWTSPAADTPGAQAFALYTNYDGQGHGFGDQAIAARSSAPDDAPAYASRDSATGDLLVLALNHRPDAVLRAHMHGAEAKSARRYQFDASDPRAIRDVGQFSLDEPMELLPESISLLRISG
jgi:glycosyl hydrolase family 44